MNVEQTLELPATVERRAHPPLCSTPCYAIRVNGKLMGGLMDRHVAFEIADLLRGCFEWPVQILKVPAVIVG